jgi:hypothetical protein
MLPAIAMMHLSKLFPRRAQQLAKESKSLMYALTRIAVASFTNRNNNYNSSRSLISLWKDELVTIAKRDQNSIALSLLSIDQTVGLLRYHGILPYVSKLLLQHRWFSLPSNSSTTQNESIQPSSTTNSLQQKTPPPKAKIAFMITSSQKLALIEKLGYDIGQIKKMKPLEALLALEHNVTPGNEEVIAKLVEENEALLREEAIRKKEEITSRITTVHTTSSSSSSDHFTQGWYEVIQESIGNTNTTLTIDGQEQSSSSTTVIALYPTEEEALSCVTIKEELLALRTRNKTKKSTHTSGSDTSSIEATTTTSSSSISTTRFYIRKKQKQD